MIKKINIIGNAAPEIFFIFYKLILYTNKKFNSERFKKEN